jgi:hypothetical protein
VNSHSIQDRIRARKRRIKQRLDKFNFPTVEGPLLRASNIHYELGDRAVGTAYGGIGLMHQLVREVGLAREIDRRLHLFKVHLPYHESDHVLNLAYNALCDGTCLEDLEQRRQDEAYLNALGAERIPDPTTAGDFCRRFQREHLETLEDAFDAARRKVWARQPAEFFDEARIDADGSLVGTAGECKQGMNLAYNGTWGYHPLVVSLANTGEVLRLVNRPGNRPSYEGAAAEIDHSIRLCRAAGFRQILLRGDTDFTQTTHLDRWHELGNVRFIFGMDVTAHRSIDADDLAKSAWKPLPRPARYPVQTKPRQRPGRVKQQVVDERLFKDLRLISEEVAEMPYRPGACQHVYRLIVLRKNLSVRPSGQQRLFNDYRYFLYLTNDWESTPEEIVYSANDRCNQENLLAQLKGGVRALQAPVDNLLSNWAYMLMTSLAWNLKAWLALWTPVRPGRWREQHQAEQQRLLRMEFRTFVNAFLRIPCQIVKTGRKLVYRLLAWNPWQSVFFRLARQMSEPLRC